MIGDAPGSHVAYGFGAKMSGRNGLSEYGFY